MRRLSSNGQQPLNTHLQELTAGPEHVEDNPDNRATGSAKVVQPKQSSPMERKKSIQKDGRKKKKQLSVRSPVGIAANDCLNKSALFPISTVGFADVVWQSGIDLKEF
jgi:hypothetical protein